MRKYLLSVLAIIAATIIAAETAELALDANGNATKILIPTDAFTIEELIQLSRGHPNRDQSQKSEGAGSDAGD